MPTSSTINASNRPKPAPVEFAGQWVAWNRQQTEIVAHGSKLGEVHRAAVSAGHPDAILQKVRRPNVFFVGVM